MYNNWGKVLPDQDVASLKSSYARRAVKIIGNSDRWSLVELRSAVSSETQFEVVLADLMLEGVPSKSVSGVKTRERLALCFDIEGNSIPQVRAIRADFPVLPHTNHVPTGEPIGLCVFYEIWEEEKRLFSVEAFLKRIEGWLVKSSTSSLHQADQRLENMYFLSNVVLILPAYFAELRMNDAYNLSVYRELAFKPSGEVLFADLTTKAKSNNSNIRIICTQVEPVVHGNIERFPDNMRELIDQFQRRGVKLLDKLQEATGDIPMGTRLKHNDEERCLIVVEVPLVRTLGDKVESFSRAAYLTQIGISQAKIGETLGVFNKSGNEYHPVTLVGGLKPIVGNIEDIILKPITLLVSPTPAMLQQGSGLTEAECDFTGVIGGLGALGSALADMWIRSGWGRWTFIDQDILLPHNLVRHRGFYNQIGMSKGQVADLGAQFTYGAQSDISNYVDAKLTDKTNDTVVASINGADLVVDATTTNYVPRELSANSEISRAASLFLTPSGRSAIILLEDRERQLKLDAVEAQYYREILTESWGETHLLDESGKLVVGPSCRDLSSKIPYDSVLFLAGKLSIELRKRAMLDAASVAIVHGEPLQQTEPVLHTCRRISVGQWTVVSNVGIENSIQEYRRRKLPNETGGIVLGYFDLFTRHIYIVNVETSPADSVETPSKYVRGISGVHKVIKDARSRTGGVVGYVGEWHSHPDGCSAKPSKTDEDLIDTLSKEMSEDGVPVLMVIVSENDCTYNVRAYEDERV